MPRGAPLRSRIRIDDLIEHAARDVGDVELAARVLAEGADGERRREHRPRGPRAVGLRGAPDRARAIVAVEVDATQPRETRAAIAIAAGDRAAEAVAVLEDRHGQAGGRAVGRGVVAVRRFHETPAVVLAAGAARRLQVDLFVLVLADVGHPEVAGLAVEGETPRVAQAVRPDLAARAGARGERVGGGDGVRRAVDVDARELAEKLAEVLAVIVRIAAGAAVADADVEVAVGPELQLAAVVIGELGVRDGEDDGAAGDVGAVGIGGEDGVARDGDVAVRRGVVDEEETVRRVVRMEGEAEEPALVAAGNEAADVEEGRGQDARAVPDDDGAALLDDEEPGVARADDAEGRGEAARDPLQRDFLRGGGEWDEKSEQKYPCRHDSWTYL